MELSIEFLEVLCCVDVQSFGSAGFGGLAANYPNNIVHWTVQLVERVDK